MNILTKIWTGAVTVWDDVVKDVDEAEAAIIKAVPAMAPVIAADKVIVKQAAAAALAYVTTIDAKAGKALAIAVEGTGDAALIAATGGVALPYVPLVNDAVDQIVANGVAAFNAWALATKAKLAVNTQATMTPPAST